MTRSLLTILLIFTGAFNTFALGGQSDADTTREVAVVITIGQSNADGSAFFSPELDSIARLWYDSRANRHNLRIWYRSTRVVNRESNALGEHARHVVDGEIQDAPPGWMELWYRNENNLGRTAMNMIHGYGTYSTGADVNCAQGRRGMEPQFGIEFATALPETELYIIKLGVSGSFISSWANPADDTNWRYFIDNIYRPAIADLIRQGKQPRLAGIWWMQGCADHGKPVGYYEESLLRLVSRLDSELGFRNPPIYIGTIPAPGESTAHPDGSVGYCPNVRSAQQAVASATPFVTLIDTSPFEMQYEPAFNGTIHFSHAGVNAIATTLAHHIIANRPNWPSLHPAD